LLGDQSFNSGSAGWTLEEKHSGATMSVVNGDLRCQSGGSWAQDDEVMCRMQVNVTQGRTYCVEMDVLAGGQVKEFKYQIRRPISPWTSHGPYKADVHADTNRTRKSGVFVADQTDASAQLTLMVGKDTTALFVDNITMCFY
jgi:hypothetical protein